MRRTPDKISGDALFDPYLKKSHHRENSVVLLLPMSGKNAEVGRHIANACMLASRNIAQVDFFIIDTEEPRYDLSDLAKKFPHLRAVIGPIFYEDIKKYEAVFAKTPLFSLSNNLKINDEHVYACGLSPQDEIRCLVQYARSHGIQNFLLLMPEGNYPAKIADFFKHELHRRGYDPENDIEVIKYVHLSNKKAKTLVKNSEKQAVFIMEPILDTKEMEHTPIFTLSSLALSDRSNWEGAIFAFPSGTEEQEKFSETYKTIFGESPTILDMIAYDVVTAICNSVKDKTGLWEQENSGCLGNFLLDKKLGLQRDMQIYTIKDAEKVTLDQERCESSGDDAL